MPVAEAYSAAQAAFLELDLIGVHSGRVVKLARLFGAPEYNGWKRLLLAGYAIPEFASVIRARERVDRLRHPKERA